MNDKIKLRITALSDNNRRYAVVFMREKIAVAFSRDSGAKIGYGIRMIDGNISSGGSRKNWYCSVSAGSIFELEIDRAIFDKSQNLIKKWKMEEIEDFSITEEKSRLMHDVSENLE